MFERELRLKLAFHSARVAWLDGQLEAARFYPVGSTEGELTMMCTTAAQERSLNAAYAAWLDQMVAAGREYARATGYESVTPPGMSRELRYTPCPA